MVILRNGVDPDEKPYSVAFHLIFIACKAPESIFSIQRVNQADSALFKV